MADRRRPAAPPRNRPAGRRDQLGTGFAVSDNAKTVLRAIRDELDNQCTYRGSNARTAALAGLSEREAQLALFELSQRGMVKLYRTPLQT